MDEKYLERFKQIFTTLDGFEDEVLIIKEKLERTLEKTQERLDKYEMIVFLTDRQEETFDNLQMKADELEEDIEKLDDFLENISEAIDSIGFDISLLQKRVVKFEQITQKLKAKLNNQE